MGQFSSVQSLSHVWLFVTPCTTACQASLSITNSQSSPKFMSIELVMPSSHLILWQIPFHHRVSFSYGEGFGHIFQMVIFLFCLLGSQGYFSWISTWWNSKTMGAYISYVSSHTIFSNLSELPLKCSYYSDIHWLLLLVNKSWMLFLSLSNRSSTFLNSSFPMTD